MVTITRTPLRISFIGGGTDFPNFYEKYGGGVISTTIKKYVYVSVNNKFDNRIKLSYSQNENVKNIKDIKHTLIKNILIKYKIKKNLELVSLADIPSTGTGLGSSSAFTISAISSINKHYFNKYFSKKKLADLACDIEINQNKSPIGIQDQYACSYGGLNYISLNKKKITVNRVKVSKSDLNYLQNSLVLVYTNITRNANNILSKHQAKIKKNTKLDFLKETNDHTLLLLENLNKGNIDYLSESLNKSWNLKKQFNRSVSNNYIDKLIEFGLENGARGAKLLGAGKGGFVLFYVNQRKKNNFVSKFKKNTTLDVELDDLGTKVTIF